MLRTNSKQVKEKVINYIMESSHDYLADNYDISLDHCDWKDYQKAINSIFYNEMLKHSKYNQQRFVQDVFYEWAQGLSMGQLFIYYYSVSAVQLVGDWLEQTQEERSKYSEEQAEKLATYLIFKTLDVINFEVDHD